MSREDLNKSYEIEKLAKKKLVKLEHEKENFEDEHLKAQKELYKKEEKLEELREKVQAAERREKEKKVFALQQKMQLASVAAHKSEKEVDELRKILEIKHNEINENKSTYEELQENIARSYRELQEKTIEGIEAFAITPPKINSRYEIKPKKPIKPLTHDCNEHHTREQKYHPKELRSHYPDESINYSAEKKTLRQDDIDSEIALARTRIFKLNKLKEHRITPDVIELKRKRSEVNKKREELAREEEDLTRQISLKDRY